MKKTDDEIIIEEGTKFVRIPTYLPYSYWRIVRILNDYCNCYMVRICGYKESRYPGYKSHYDIYENGTDRLIAKHVYLHGLRCLFAKNGIPLEEPEDKRNPKAVQFLKIVKEISENQ